MENLAPDEHIAEETPSEEKEPVTTPSGESQPAPDEPVVATEQVHQQTSSGSIIAPIGDHSQITVIYGMSYYDELVKKAMRRAVGWGDDEERKKGTDESGEYDAIAENLLFGQQNLSRLDDVSSQAVAYDENPPLEEEKLSAWYYKLDEYEQCYVQVVAILHGASAHNMYQKTDELYRLNQVQKYAVLHKEKAQQEDLFELIAKENQTFTFPRKQRVTLLKRTHTLMSRVKGTVCIFWQDVNELGQSIFASHVLSFLAQEFIGKGEHWKHFLATIETWASEPGESAWRAARALGVILWYQDLTQLQKKAVEWVKKHSTRSQELAASLLDAAREVELRSLPAGAQQTEYSPVLELLRTWTTALQEKLTLVNIYAGCAAAKTYSLVGKNGVDTDLALRGVHDLLLFRRELTFQSANNLLFLQQGNERKNISSLVGAVVSTYVNLTWSGHLRVVLAHLAEIAEALISRWTIPETLVERSRSRMQREICLKVVFKAFFLIAAATSAEKKSCTPDEYNQPLAEQIAIPDPAGRNVFLAAIVREDMLASSLRTLLGSAVIVTGYEQERKLAFELIHQWIDTVALVTQDTSSAFCKGVVQFLVELGKTIETWYRETGRRGYRMPDAGEIYLHKLEQWRAEGAAARHAREHLVRDVLTQLRVNGVSSSRDQKKEKEHL